MSNSATSITYQLANAICDRMAAGASLRSICREPGMPSEATVRRWATEDQDGFAAKYAWARAEQAHALVDEIIDTARTETDAGVGRMRVDALKWAASKILPRTYGDKVDVEHRGGMTLEMLVAQSYQTVEHKAEDVLRLESTGLAKPL